MSVSYDALIIYKVPQFIFSSIELNFIWSQCLNNDLGKTKDMSDQQKDGLNKNRSLLRNLDANMDALVEGLRNVMFNVTSTHSLVNTDREHDSLRSCILQLNCVAGQSPFIM